MFGEPLAQDPKYSISARMFVGKDMHRVRTGTMAAAGNLRGVLRHPCNTEGRRDGLRLLQFASAGTRHTCREPFRQSSVHINP